MSKPFKTNEVPVAPFNLRTEGPMTLLAASAAVHGKNFRAATGSDPDKRATVDKDPCPHCGAQVEWVHTVQAGAKSVYARCRGATVHRWGFRGRVDSPAPKPTMMQWLDEQIQKLNAEVEKLRSLRSVAGSLPLPEPRPSVH